jgi:uncharacterized protein
MKLALALLLLAGPDYPQQKGLVNDYAGVLSPDVKAKIEESLRGLQAAKKFVLVLVTVKSLEGQSIEQYTVGLANTWKIGEKGKNNGVVFLIAPQERKARIENGYGAEETLTDIDSKFVLEEKVIPFFKDGKLSEGAKSGTEALVAILGGTAPHATRAPPTYLGLSGTTIIILVIVVLVILVILMSTPTGRDFLVFALDSSLSSSSSSSSRSSNSSSSSSSSDDDSSSSSGGGSFGGGGASSSW